MEYIDERRRTVIVTLGSLAVAVTVAFVLWTLSRTSYVQPIAWLHVLSLSLMTLSALWLATGAKEIWVNPFRKWFPGFALLAIAGLVAGAIIGGIVSTALKLDAITALRTAVWTMVGIELGILFLLLRCLMGVKPIRSLGITLALFSMILDIALGPAIGVTLVVAQWIICGLVASGKFALELRNIGNQPM